MEKAEITFPITEENFAQAWAWVDEKRRNAIVRKMVRKISDGVGNFLFFLLACLLLYGYYRQVDSTAFGEFLRRIPVFPQIWDWLLANLITPELGTWGQVGVLAALLYGIPFLAEAVISGVVRLCCKPKENPLLRSDPERKARLEEEDRILALAEEIKARRLKEREALLKKPKKKE